MTLYLDVLPQSECKFCPTEAGLKTDLIFKHGIERREFASHTFSNDPAAWLSPSIESIVASEEVARDVKLRSCRTVRSILVVQSLKGGLI